MAKIFKVWARVEVYDTVEDEHEDLNPSECEFKVGEFFALEDVADFMQVKRRYNSDALDVLKNCMDYQFGENWEDNNA